MMEIIYILTIIVILGILIYYAVVLHFKHKEANERRKTLLTLASNVEPQDGSNGPPGKSAYEQWKNQDLPARQDVTEEEFNNMFTNPATAIDGLDAISAVAGGPGSDGSFGGVGLGGVDGSDGSDGATGVDGVPGDSFITFEYRDAMSAPITNIPDDLPTYKNDFPTRAEVKYYDVTNGDSTREIAYYLKGELITTITIHFNTQSPGIVSNAYLSFIIYDTDYNIIGLTSPLTLTNFIRSDGTPDNPPLTQITITEGLTPTNIYPLKYRAIISLNKGLTMSSFTTNVTEKNLEMQSFSYSRKEESSTFINDFYKILDGSINIIGNDFELNEVVQISRAFNKNEVVPAPGFASNIKLNP